MNRYLAFAIALLLVATNVPERAQRLSPFRQLAFEEHREYVVRCAAGLECDVQLQAGERVNDGFNAHIDQWDPHIGYSGEDKVTPHLILRPSTGGLRTNIILTTTKRTYYLLAISTQQPEPSYYSFTYPDETFKVLNRLSLATQAALHAELGAPVPYATATPANVARLASTCVDYDYAYLVDRNTQSDHPPHARPASEPLPQNLIPRVVCTDGQHTFIEFPRQQEVPSDLPISLAVTSEGDTLIDYTYLAALNRFTIDGVYDSFVLEIGSQDQPLRLRIYHSGRGNPPRDQHLIKISPPGDVHTIDAPVVPMQLPLISTEAAPQPHAQVDVPQVVPTASAAPAPVPSAVSRARMRRNRHEAILVEVVVFPSSTVVSMPRRNEVDDVLTMLTIGPDSAQLQTQTHVAPTGGKANR